MQNDSCQLMLISVVLVVVFVYFIFKKPLDSFFAGKDEKYTTIDDKYNAQKQHKQAEIDTLLEKISKKGLDGLSAKERQRLEELSR